MSEDKIPSGMMQVGAIVKGGGLNVENAVKDAEKEGFTCVDCGDYVMLCGKGKKR